MTISAKIIQDSVSPFGKRITTYELENVRFTHAEFLTHRVFSRNSASSRAIPIQTMIALIEANPAMPIHWGKNQAGMQAKEELSPFRKKAAKKIWLLAMKSAVEFSLALHKIGVHKQIANRLTEPFQHMKVVMTTTEDANWFWLRDHPDAQPEIRELAIQMQTSKDASKPMLINPGEWHVPYVNRRRDSEGNIVYFLEEYFDGVQEPVERIITLEEAKQISSSCCAQVSYRKTDDSIEKAQFVFDRLVKSEPVHASPFEQQATPIKSGYSRISFDHTNVEEINMAYNSGSWEEGITHVDREGNFWSGNFQGWIQHRQLIPNNAKK